MTDEIKHIIRETIHETVNGKIDSLALAVAELDRKLEEQKETMAPAIETLETIQNGRKFIVWSIPIFVFIGGLIAFIKRI